MHVRFSTGLTCCVFCCCLAAVLGVRAETLELAIDSGEQKLSAALTAVGSSLAQIKGGDHAAYDIVKTGGGTLVFDSGSADLSSWVGNLTAETGVVKVVWTSSLTNMLGNAATGIVTIKSGATLFFDISSATADKGGIARPIHIAGTGAEGMYGALRTKTASGKKIRDCVPRHLVLDADATWSFDDSSEYAQVVCENDKRVTANGHTFTITSAGMASVEKPTVFFDNITFDDPYVLVLDNVADYFRGADFGAGTGSSIILTNSTQLLLTTGRNAFGQKSTLVVDETADARFSVPVNDREHNIWYGPVQLKRGILPLSNSGLYAGNERWFEFAGPVTGVGGISTIAAASPDATTGEYNRTNRLVFSANGNTFSGGLTLSNAILSVKSPGNSALSNIGGGIALYDTSVDFIGLADETLSLPAATFETSQQVTRRFLGSNGFKPLPTINQTGTLTKTGPGTLEIGGILSAETVNIAEGTVRVLDLDAYDARRGSGGLYEGVLWRTDPGYGSITKAPYDCCYTNSFVQALPAIFTATRTDTKDWTYAYRTYSGYVWNDEATNRTWTFVNVIHGNWEMTVADQTFKNEPNNPISTNSPSACGNNAIVTNIVLKPGPNVFRIRYVAQQTGTPNVGGVATNNLANWPDCQNIVIDKEGRGSLDWNDGCYHLPTVTGEKPDLTFLSEEDFRVLRAGRENKISQVTGSGTLDLAGGILHVDSVADGVTVENGFLINDQTGTTNLIAASGTVTLPRPDWSGKAGLTEGWEFRGIATWTAGSKGTGTPGYYGTKPPESHIYQTCFHITNTTVDVSGWTTADWKDTTKTEIAGYGVVEKKYWDNTTPARAWVNYVKEGDPIAGTNVVLRPEIAFVNNTTGKEYGRYMPYCYQGYLWNDDPTNVEMTVMSLLHAPLRLEVGGSTYCNDLCEYSTGRFPSGVESNAFCYTFELAPGPSTFRLYVGNSFLSAGYFVSATQDVQNLDRHWDGMENRLALAIRRGGESKNADDGYMPLADSGAGEFFTRSTNNVMPISGIQALTFANASATVNLNVRDGIHGQHVAPFEVGTLNGVGTIANGDVKVTDSFVVPLDASGVPGQLTVNGSLDLTGATVSFSGGTEPARADRYVIATATSMTGDLPAVASPACDTWQIQRTETQLILSRKCSGMAIMFR